MTETRKAGRMPWKERADLFLGAAKEDCRVAERLTEAGYLEEALIFIKAARKFKRLANAAVKSRPDQTAQGEGGGAWKCWTCDYSTLFEVRRICRSQGHDIRRVEGKASA